MRVRLLAFLGRIRIFGLRALGVCLIGVCFAAMGVIMTPVLAEYSRPLVTALQAAPIAYIAGAVSLAVVIVGYRLIRR
jgi:hypothetical protein